MVNIEMGELLVAGSRASTPYQSGPHWRVGILGKSDAIDFGIIIVPRVDSLYHISLPTHHIKEECVILKS